ncbi:MAG: D-aminoacyl-tRNA deacylase [Flavobacteriales bacterium]|jgi:D-tyrosyl-tRNA(Tyr) deacylase|nr:D-aminoacyl-tRNA deacylase [Flavobacteriales bacterium]
MRMILQRVSQARLTSRKNFLSEIQNGLFILVGVGDEDSKEDAKWLVQKVLKCRIFSDENDLMNLSVMDTKGELLVVSQFTLHASYKKGNRPSFIKAAKAQKALELYEYTVNLFKEQYQESAVKMGSFGNHMEISCVNDGPVTLIFDSKNKE